jgi:hypothetical protein
MSDNRINNNDEILEFMRLEALVRVYFSDKSQNNLLGKTVAECMENLDRLKIAIKLKLDAIDTLRGYKFDTKAAAEEILK